MREEASVEESTANANTGEEAGVQACLVRVEHKIRPPSKYGTSSSKPSVSYVG